MRTLVLVVLPALLLGCPPPNPAPPASDDLAVEADAACSNLKRIGCPEGQGSINGVSCSVVIVRAAALRPLPLECWKRAATAAEAQACGALRCVR